MALLQRKKIGAKHKLDRSAHHKTTGKYTKQAVRTELSRKRKQLKHQKTVEKKASKRVLFSLK